jgi:hypothetical protein
VKSEILFPNYLNTIIMKLVNQVYETTDYSLFKFMQGNRPVHRPHIIRLRKSFEKKYLFSPIIVNEKYEIIDGQHRFTTAKELNLPVIFIIVSGYGLSEVQTLNANMSNWGQKDYLNAYCDLGYPEYLKVRDFMIQYADFGIKSSLIILLQKTNADRQRRNIKELRSEANKSGVMQLRFFEEGELVIPDYDSACHVAEKILEFKPYYDGFNRSTFVAAAIQVLKVEGYDHRQMISKIAQNPRSMVHCQNAPQYKEMLEEIYNYRSRDKLSFKYS